MKTRDDDNLVLCDAEEQPIGKLAQACTTHIRQHRRELQRVGHQELYYAIDFGTEARTQTGRLVLVPVLRLDQFGLLRPE